MNILIIGGSGFIGSHTAKKLYLEGHKITIADIRAPYRPNMIDVNYKYVFCDINNAPQVSKVIEQSKCDIIYLFASVIRAEEVRKDPENSLSTNIHGLINCLNASRNLDLHRFVFSSTTHLYNCENTVVNEETEICNDMHLYPGSKFCCETLIKGFSKLYNIPYTIFRYSVAYGIYGHEDNVLHQFVKKCLRGEDLLVYNNGNKYRDFLYVSDHAKGNKLALIPSTKNHTILLGGETINLYKLAELIKEKTNSLSKIKKIDDDRVGDHVGNNIFNSQKANSYGWERSISLQEGIDIMTKYYASK